MSIYTQLLWIFILADVLQFALTKTICCDRRIGCFKDDAPFTKMPLPECPGEMNVQFSLYNKHFNVQVSQYLNRTTLPTFWKQSRKTVFLIHGYLQSGSVGWIHNLKAAFLNKHLKQKWNVVIVDWSGGSQNAWYPSSASNVRSAGAELGLVIRNMIQNRPEHYIYCVGHSLGAHVCGHAGLRTRIDRITGLDPAGPWFENEDQAVGLHPGSANYVDVIHTHGEAHMTAVFNLGSMKPMGHVDFYPNGGDRQPGCYIDPVDLIQTGMDSGLAELVKKTISQTSQIGLNLLNGDVPGACSHQRVIHFFMESLLNKCNFVARHICTDPKNLPGSCTECDGECQEMGFYSGSKDHYLSQGIFYLETNRRSPFCKG